MTTIPTAPTVPNLIAPTEVTPLRWRFNGYVLDEESGQLALTGGGAAFSRGAVRNMVDAWAGDTTYALTPIYAVDDVAVLTVAQGDEVIAYAIISSHLEGRTPLENVVKDTETIQRALNLAAERRQREIDAILELINAPIGTLDSDRA